jgi:hypothetical protein
VGPTWDGEQQYSNTDKLSTVFAKLEYKVITPGDAIVFAQALETKLMDKCKTKHAIIMDPFLIPKFHAISTNNQLPLSSEPGALFWTFHQLAITQKVHPWRTKRPLMFR